MVPLWVATGALFPFIFGEEPSQPLLLGRGMWPPAGGRSLGHRLGRGGGGGWLQRLVGPSVCQTYEDQHSSEEEEEEEESEDGDEEDDITSAESESSEEEEGEHGDQQTANRQQQLEWDDSTLSY